MKKWFFILLILIIPFVSISQGIFYLPCKDPLKYENLYYPCYQDYSPVCACDGNTYRSICSAENQHAINAANYIDGPCSDFHYVVEPNLVNYVLQLSIYRKKDGYVNIKIYDVYGHLFLDQTFFISSSVNNNVTHKEINEVAAFQHGLYIIEMDSDGEKLVRKFFKAKTD